MKENEFTYINGENVVLIPYRKKHVETYHEWMQSEELLELTASEPLSIEEEYDMQLSWQNDDDKCTFIILDKEIYENSLNENVNQYVFEKNEPERGMVGDVNLFFNDTENKNTAEIEIMIAVKTSRGKGIGIESIKLMMNYGKHCLDVDSYTAKISFKNKPSINLFENRLNFQEISRSKVFEEITYEYKIEDNEVVIIKDKNEFENQVNEYKEI
eukprot:TRINITY_DN123_c0_g1_i1.p1 TRINITY_DN123_c0_g1~~TRINITY_DN123_c0_g1_i1.p1  ORF type:complete len:214 (+),score=64.09 TRINITY_DN123_c0_g1_i1:276-917(+)